MVAKWRSSDLGNLSNSSRLYERVFAKARETLSETLLHTLLRYCWTTGLVQMTIILGFNSFYSDSTEYVWKEEVI